jgi:hypothetical protein
LRPRAAAGPAPCSTSGLSSCRHDTSSGETAPARQCTNLASRARGKITPAARFAGASGT